MAPARTPANGHYQVVIVGGGIAGITLALACERLDIVYALLEAHDSLAPAEGAGIGLQANGLRILDQLGALEQIERDTVPTQVWRHFDEDGNLVATNKALSHYLSKIGYGCLYLERQKLLEIMSGRLQGKGLVKTSCRVSSLQENENHVTITATDDFSITADLVVGADGVRSCVRKFIDSSQVEERLESDDYMSTRFACVFGISRPVGGMLEGESCSVYREGVSLVTFTGKDGVVFWFVPEDLGKTLPFSKSPRYTANDIDAVCQSVAHVRVSPTGVLFGDIYANRIACTKTTLDEGIAKVWHTSRTVLVGDAAHKMVPNLALAGNHAIESVALLVNELATILDRKVSSHTRKAALARYSERRRSRTTEVQKRAGILCRAQLRHDGPGEAVFQELPTLAEADWLVRGILGFLDAPVLDGIPLSARGHICSEAMAFFSHSFKSGKYSNSELIDLMEL